jgi:hypothetical protein
MSVQAVKALTVFSNEVLDRWGGQTSGEGADTEVRGRKEERNSEEKRNKEIKK